MSDKTMTAWSYEFAVEVKLSERWTYEVPGAAEVESVEDLVDAGLTFGDTTPLQGWGKWEAAVSAVDEDGCARHYFLARGVDMCE